RRPEAAAPALLDVVRRDRPRAALFGHVHQPLAPRARVGHTECVNVGHFRRTGVPYVLRW
ncbi:MAG TPA: metallophosphoesterase, partial [Pseudonocardia sp.]